MLSSLEGRITRNDRAVFIKKRVMKVLSSLDSRITCNEPRCLHKLVELHVMTVLSSMDSRITCNDHVVLIIDHDVFYILELRVMTMLSS